MTISAYIIACQLFTYIILKTPVFKIVTNGKKFHNQCTIQYLISGITKKIPPSGRISFLKFNYENRFSDILKSYKDVAVLFKIF